MYPNEDQLVRDVQTATPHSSYQQDALEAAILNKWDGPFMMLDFSKWLKNNRLNGLMHVARDDISGGQEFPILSHTPKEKFNTLIIDISVSKSDIGLFIIAVDKGIRSDDVEPYLQDVPKTDNGDDPIVYDMRPIVFPGSLMQLEEKK